MEDKAQSTHASTKEETWYFKGIHLNTNVKIMYVRCIYGRQSTKYTCLYSRRNLVFLGDTLKYKCKDHVNELYL